MRSLLFLVPLLVVGCGPLPFGEAFRIQSRSCEVNFLGWHGGLTHHILQGPRDGTFDYSPDGALRERTSGHYDLDSGEFSWDEQFHSDHYRALRRVEGVGDAKTNGDLDLHYTATTTDVNQETWSVEVREERVGCEVARRTRTGDEEWLHRGTYVRGAYEYTDGPADESDPWRTEGVLHRDGTWLETMDVETVDFLYSHEEEGDDAGYARRDWVEIDGSVTYDGVRELFLDGSVRQRYDIIQGQERAHVDYTVDYDGYGGGTYEDCALTFEAWDCTMECPGSAPQSC